MHCQCVRACAGGCADSESGILASEGSATMSVVRASECPCQRLASARIQARARVCTCAVRACACARARTHASACALLSITALFPSQRPPHSPQRAGPAPPTAPAEPKAARDPSHNPPLPQPPDCSAPADAGRAAPAGPGRHHTGRSPGRRPGVPPAGGLVGTRPWRLAANQLRGEGGGV